MLDNAHHRNEHTSDQNAAARLDVQQIPYIPAAGYQPDKCCLPGTRTALLDQISEWALNTDPNTVRVLLLLGPAGTGKSSIAHTIAGRFSTMGRLGSAFCFSRNEARTRKPASLLRNIARDLASRDPAFLHALAKSIEDDSEACGTKDLNVQFERFILRPARALRPNANLLFLIDALDESGTVEERRKLLALVRRRFAELPSTWRVLITGREEGDISAAFGVARHVQVQRMPTMMDDRSLLDDILLYTRHSLTSEDTPGLVGGLSDDNCKALAKKSEGIFQWSFVTCEYIKQSCSGETSLRRCQRILEEMDVGLDTLYHFVLFNLMGPVDEDDYEATSEAHDPYAICCLILGFLINAFEPLSKRSLRSLLAHLPESPCVDVDHFLRALASLLSGVHEEERSIRPLHSSFTELLCSPERAKRFYVGGPAHHGRLALSSLSLLKGSLHFNMGNFPTSYISNKNLLASAGPSNIIGGDVKYACKHWGYHTSKCIPNIKETWSLIRELVRHLFSKNLLYWIEAGSIVGATANLEACLSQALTSLRGLDRELGDVAEDSIRFLRRFAPVLTESSAHLYISALIWCPFNSRLAQVYDRLKGRVSRISTGRVADWPHLEFSMAGHSAPVTSVALSPDGTRIISGSEDHTVRLWNAITGEEIGEVGTGHQARVTSVAFSPNGKDFISGSEDNTIRVWNASNGEAIGEPITGHTDWITCVAFSHDGTRMVSGSWDNTVRMWNATTREAMGEPIASRKNWATSVAFSPDDAQIIFGSSDKTLRIYNTITGEARCDPFSGHMSRVSSVAFSANGTRIISGAWDRAIRVWNATTGEAMGNPITGHTQSISSVAFSPDGSRIVSGSWDKTVRLWNAITGEPIGGPFTGHTNSVTSVAFSPDGKRIVSGSEDNTIRVWNTATRQAMDEPAPAHTAEVTSVAFSSDGAHIASSSHDHTIRIWDATTGEANGPPIAGHTAAVTSVAFSIDGTRIVSGSDDNTIRMWDRATGAEIGQPMTGHTIRVTSVAFSPDGTRLASGSWDNTIRIWNAITGKPVGVPITGHTVWVTSVAFSPDGRSIASGSEDNTIRLWDALTGEAIGPPIATPAGRVTSIAFSPCGARIAGSWNQTVQVWNASTGESIGRPMTGHTNEVSSVALSPDGRYIASASHDKTVRLWNASTHEAIGQPITGHTDSVTCVAFSPDGKRVVSGSRDLTLRVISATAENEMQERTMEPAGSSGKVRWRALPTGKEGARHAPGIRISDNSTQSGHSAAAIPFDQKGKRRGSSQTLSKLGTDLEPDMALAISRLDERQGIAAKSGTLSHESEDDVGDHGGFEDISGDIVSLPYLTLSPHPEHQMQQGYMFPHRSKPSPVTLNYRTGWIMGNGKDRLLWVPPDMVRRLYTGRMQLAIPGPTIHVDLSRFTHGTRWTEAFNPPSTS